VFWGLGCLDPAGPVVGTHSPHFAPAIESTLSTGVRALTLAALSRLRPAG
jgi:hypothetical protein